MVKLLLSFIFSSMKIVFKKKRKAEVTLDKLIGISKTDKSAEELIGESIKES